MKNEEPYINFVDSWSCLADGIQVKPSFSEKNDSDEIYLSNSDKTRLAETVQKTLKITTSCNKLKNE